METETVWSVALWRQYGAAIETLDNAIAACPDALWRERLWEVPQGDEFWPDFSAYWYVGYHALLWLDAYLSADLDHFAPPAPYSPGEMGPEENLPKQPYTKEEVRAYLVYVREKARARLSALTGEQASQPFEFPWLPGKPITYLELQLYSMRHTQEHAAQLLFFLGGHNAPEVPDWVMWEGTR